MRLILSNKYLVILSAISLAFLASMFRYASKTELFPQWDEQHYMHMASGFYRLLQDPSLDKIREMAELIPYRQPGYSLFILPFLFAFGLSEIYLWGLITNGLFYVSIAFGIYLISKNYLSELSSFLAAVIFMFYGWTLFFVHFTYSETVSSALCVWTMFFLIKSNFFKEKKFTLLFGLLFGLSLLTRWVTIIFILPPLAYFLYKGIRKNIILNRKILINLSLAIILTILIAFYPYYINWSAVIVNFINHRQGGPVWEDMLRGERDLFTSYSATFYIRTFEQLGIFYFALIVSGIILALRKTSRLKIFLLTVSFSWAFLSFFSIIKGDRYIIPIYPYLAILSASVFDSVKNSKYKFILILLTLILSFGTFFGSVWGKGPMKESLFAIPLNLGDHKKLEIHLTTISRPPYIYKITGKDVVKFIKENSEKEGIKNPQVLSLFYYRPLDEPIMTYNLYHLEKPLIINNFIGTVVTDPDNGSEYVKEVIKKSDYIMIKSGSRVDNFFHEPNYTTLKALIELFDNYNFEVYYEKKTKIWVYQDSSEVTVYKKVKDIPEEELEKIRLKFVELLF